MARTPVRTFRIEDDLWFRAHAAAAARETDLSTVIRAALERFVKRVERETEDE
jgi:predicted transcriptional regulator